MSGKTKVYRVIIDYQGMTGDDEMKLNVLAPSVAGALAAVSHRARGGEVRAITHLMDIDDSWGPVDGRP